MKTLLQIINTDNEHNILMVEHTTIEQLSKLFQNWKDVFIAKLNCCHTIQDVIQVVPLYISFDESKFNDVDEFKHYLIDKQAKIIDRNLADYKQIEEDIISLRIK